MNYYLLKKLRKSLGMNQEQVAEEIGVTRQAYSLYECGKTQPPMDILMKISVLYKVSLNELFYSGEIHSKARKNLVSDIQKKINEALEKLDEEVQEEIFEFVLFKLSRLKLFFI